MFILLILNVKNVGDEKMLANLIGGLVLANVGLILGMYIIVNDFQSKLHLLWLIPIFILGTLILGSSFRMS